MSGIYVRGEKDTELKTEIVFRNLTTGESLTLKNVMPTDLAIGPSQANYSPQTVSGRSSPVHSYGSGDIRTLSFNLSLHRDMFEGKSEKAISDEYQKTLDFFDALNYPVYTGSGVIPPQCYCRILKTTNIKGYASTHYTLKKPIDRYGRYIHADISIEITEILNVSWDATEIANGCVSRNEVASSR